MAKHLFMASTPFNVLTAAMVAFELPQGDVAELGLIDQTSTTAAFRDALWQWHSSPFDRLSVLSEKASGQGKRQQRLVAFQRIQQRLSELQPDWIYCGNDRRVEFQFAMAHSNARGVYLDDGTYSYLGRKTHWLKDQVLDNMAKKLAYGGWWKQPPAIGASAWIDHSILAFPASALPVLQSKPCKPLPNNLQRPEFAQLAQMCLGDNPLTLDSLNGLLLLPHSSVMSDQQQTLGQWLDNCGADIAYKHHPRTRHELQSAGMATSHWQLPARARPVPAAIPMEMLLPLLPQHCKISGDVSTALLTAKWLRPELDVSAAVNAGTDASWQQLLTTLGIRHITGTR
ncbi:MAG: hypothetical protein LRY66_18140 [Saccharospirillaceae bacterium]|nr:hypothetical protein [Saccharospirillaceae bacterium]MCD8533221.1 hypothetical protein [Saccharospirillaceae bacterium]